jgi:hypothetical protein
MCAGPERVTSKCSFLEHCVVVGALDQLLHLSVLVLVVFLQDLKASKKFTIFVFEILVVLRKGF